MSADTKEFDMWMDEVPLIVVYSDTEFLHWMDEVPIEEQGAGGVAVIRRNVFEF